MSTIDRSSLEPLPGFRSREVASFLAQLDDQSRLLLDDIADISADELEWQPRPGMNTIGMLLAHIAVVEIWWTGIAFGESDPRSEPILGIRMEDDGMPLPEEGAPPAVLAGKDRAYFEDLLHRARAHVKERFRATTDADLDREVERVRADGTRRVTGVRWILYHLLEHFAGHYGQILLLRHLHRVARAPAKV